jgi:PEP-CTERM motif
MPRWPLPATSTPAWALAALLLPLAADAQSWGASAAIHATAVLNLPDQPQQAITKVDNFSFNGQPQALLPTTLGHVSTVSNGGTATAQFQGSIGMLKSYSYAAFGYGYDAQGYGLFTGYASATAQGSFADAIVVTGAGLAVGTPVSYRVDFSIDGTLSSPSFEIGGFLNASAGATVRLTDLQSGQQVSFDWDASRQANGVYSRTLDTQVGHTLQILGLLNTSAGVTHYAQLGRSAEADYFHTARYALAPSVAGLNTVGASGHDFAVSSVPEPANWALFGAGLMALTWLKSRRTPA